MSYVTKVWIYGIAGNVFGSVAMIAAGVAGTWPFILWGAVTGLGMAFLLSVDEEDDVGA